MRARRLGTGLAPVRGAYPSRVESLTRNNDTQVPSRKLRSRKERMDRIQRGLFLHLIQKCPRTIRETLEIIWDRFPIPKHPINLFTAPFEQGENESLHFPWRQITSCIIIHIFPPKKTICPPNCDFHWLIPWNQIIWKYAKRVWMSWGGRIYFLGWSNGSMGYDYWSQNKHKRRSENNMGKRVVE